MTDTDDLVYIKELEAAAEALVADCGCAAIDIRQSGHSCRSQGAKIMPNLLTRMLMLIDWMERGNSLPGDESAIVQEAHDRILELEAEREKVRVLREALNTIVAIAQHPPINPSYLRISLKALATTAPET